MIGVLEGYLVIGVVIATGWFLAHRDLLGPGAQQVLSRVVFFVATPALLFTTLQRSRLDQVFNANLIVQMVTALATFGLYLLIARRWWRPATPEWLLGGMCTSYVNGGNLGIPLSVFIFGSASYVAPVMLFQIALYAPIMMAVLDAVMGQRSSGWSRVIRPLTNPMLVASVIGIALSVAGVHLPELIMQPIDLLADMSVPGALLAFGISLSGMTSLKGAEGRHDVTVITVLKLVVQPLMAYALAAWVFGMTGRDLYACVAVAALPTAQNMLTYATRYERGRLIARNSILVTTLLSVPALVLVTGLIGA